MKVLPLDVMDYSKLIENHYYTVDKTLMIEEFLDRQSTVTLITRPRRFGKTLNMSMISQFLDITQDSKNIFKNTKIMETQYICEMNQWPTIFTSFAGAKNTIENILHCIKIQLQNEYERYEFVFQNMSMFEKRNYDMIIDFLLRTDCITQGLEDSLSFLMKMLENIIIRK